MLFYPLCYLKCVLFRLENYPEFSRFFHCGKRYRLEDTKIGDDVVNNEEKVAEILNNVYIFVVENTACKKPLSVLDKDNVTFSKAINTVIEEYKYHPSVLNIRKHSEQAKCFSFSEVTTTGVLRLIKCISIICLIEEWKTQLDKNKIVGAVLLHLSKAFGCIPNDLLIAKLWL